MTAHTLDSSTHGNDGGISSGKFVLSSEEVKTLREAHGNISDTALLRKLIGPASTLARPPTSHYKVGAVGLGESGRLFVGVNLELPGLPIGNSVHAEQFLITNAWLNGERALQTVAVSAAPCGHCRQFFCELNCADSVRFVFGEPGAPPRGLEELLPQRFGPQDLLEPGPSSPGSLSALGAREPLLLDPRDNRLALKAPGGDAAAGPGPSAALQRAALEGANRAHAPYTKGPVGCAIQLRSGLVFSGGSIESAAFNPTLPALQTALIAAIAGGALGSFEEIIECALVEAEGATVRQEGTVRYLLSSIAPSARLHALTAVKAAPPHSLRTGSGSAARSGGSLSPTSHL